MKKLLFLLTFTAAISFVFNSCKKEETDARDNYVGSFKMIEDWENVFGSAGESTYTLTITKSSADSKKIIIDNLSSVFDGILATVNGNSYTIASQTTTYDGNDWSVSGRGTLSGNRLTYTVTAEITETNVTGGFDATASGTKQ